MDTGTGRFELFNEMSHEWAAALAAHPELVFHIGEEVQVKGSRFNVVGLDSTHMMLKLLPRQAGEPTP